MYWLWDNSAIFVQPWNENARTKQKQQTKENRAFWLVYRTDTKGRGHGFWLVMRRVKKLHARELSRNQPILRFDVKQQHDLPIEQCLPHIRGFFGRKMKRPCFNLFIHLLIKQITSTYRNHFSRSYENRATPENCFLHWDFVLFMLHVLMIYEKDPLLGKRQNIYVSKRGLFPLKLNSLIRVLTVLKKLLGHPVVDQQQVNGLHVTSLVITVSNSSGMHWPCLKQLPTCWLRK